MDDKKIGFFSRVKIAVSKLENYNIFVEEKTTIAVKYFFLIVLILVLVMAGVQTYKITKMINKGYQYIQSELPDFVYEDGNLQFSENVYAYDNEYDIYLVADTGDIVKEQLEEYKNKIKSDGLIFLKNRVIYISGNQETSYDYTDFSKQYEITSLNKESLIEKIDDIGLMGIGITVFCFFLITLYIVQIISIFIDWVIISIFAYISARICRLIMTFKQAFNIGIYALTLSIILTMIYNIAYYLSGFYTDYFRTVYLLISYVYVVAVILIMKSDAVKQHIEVTKIEKIQKEVHDEMDEQEESENDTKTPDKEKNKDKDDKEENELDDQEPDGSEI